MYGKLFELKTSYIVTQYKVNKELIIIKNGRFLINKPLIDKSLKYIIKLNRQRIDYTTLNEIFIIKLYMWILS